MKIDKSRLKYPRKSFEISEIEIIVYIRNTSTSRLVDFPEFSARIVYPNRTIARLVSSEYSNLSPERSNGASESLCGHVCVRTTNEDDILRSVASAGTYVHIYARE